MSATIKAVIFDYGVLLTDDRQLLGRIRKLLGELRSFGLKIVVVSTHDRNINRELRGRNLPTPDLFLTRSRVGANKGASKWVETAADQLGVKTHEFAYVGDDDLDWRTAINTPVFYLHAEWSAPLPAHVTAVVAKRPSGVLKFFTHFLLVAPRWEYTLDDPASHVHLRVLADNDVVLSADTARGTFELRDVLSRGLEVPVGGGSKAQDVLMWHALSSLYLEGLIPGNSVFAIYPSSAPGRVSPVLEPFLRPASRLFHGYYRDDLLVRAVPAPDTSAERWRGNHDKISFLTQANTIKLNRSRENLIRDNTVLVLDDFTTSGRSLEWARNLLYAAGAERVVCLAVGKFKRRHEVYTPRGDVISPFERRDYARDQFRRVSHGMDRSADGRHALRTSFEHWVAGKSYPVP